MSRCRNFQILHLILSWALLGSGLVLPIAHFAVRSSLTTGWMMAKTKPNCPSRGLTSWKTPRYGLLMAAAGDDDAKSQESPAPVTAKGTSGTYYDDEVEPAEKEGISDAMKQRLIREATTGLDPDQKQTNVLLYIILGVAVLVLLGGVGIFY